MFTINIYLKFALIAVFIISGVALAFIFGFWYAFPLQLIGLGLLVSYIMLGTVQSAAELMQTMDFEACEKRLNLTLKPEWLYMTNRAFYFLIRGSIAMNLKENDRAEDWFEQAQKIKLPSDNERAMVALQLANINAMKGKWNYALNTFREIKKMKVTEKMLIEQIGQFEKTLQNRGQVQAASRQGGFRKGYQPGGKRKRPKMR